MHIFHNIYGESGGRAIKTWYYAFTTNAYIETLPALSVLIGTVSILTL